ncbi:MAG: rod shape-determining protein MreD [Halofilum sp. (in: g-proteobacteria)]
MTPRWWLIPTTFILALMLVMAPLPGIIEPLRPDWVTLVALYWAIALPERFGLAVAWFAGLLLDVSQGALLGQHALGVVLVTAIALRGHQRIRLSPLAQQAAFITLLLLLKQSVVLWISGLVGRAPENLWLYFASPFLALLFWPVVFVLLRDLRRRFQTA